MIRKFNYTGRIKIPRNVIEIKLKRERGKTYFNTKLDSDLLDEQNIDSNAMLILEAYDRGSYQRYNYGRLESPTQPKPENRILDEIQNMAELLWFRLRAIDYSDSNGKIVATSAEIRVYAEEVDESRKSSLLPVDQQNIGEAIWQIDYNVADDQVPILIVSDKINRDKLPEMLRTDAFFTVLVYPAVLREILIQTIMIGEIRTTDGDDSWGKKWLEFAHGLPGVEHIKPEKNLINDLEWIDEVVESFSNKNSMLKTILKKIKINY